jgi:putative FmdB family regulatory protein
MPTYDFECDKCGRIDEYYVPLTNSVLDKCSCGKKTKLNKLESFSKSKAILNTNGFYETDYKNK